MDNTFKKSKVFTMTLGEELKGIRENKKISLRDASSKIKIRRPYLEALESGRYQDLPADVYVKGFIKNYADFLDLDSRDYLKRYLKEQGIHSNIRGAKGEIPPKVSPKRSFIITPKKTITGLVILLVFLTLFYIYYQINSFVAPPKLSIETPTENIKIRGNSITFTGETDPEATLAINGQPVFIDDNGHFNESVTLKEGMNVLKIVATGFSGKTSEATREIIVEKSGAEVAGERTDSQDFSSDELTLKVQIKDEPTWLSVSSDEKNVFSGVMVPGSSETFTAKEKINITSGKANKTEIFLRGEYKGVLNDSPGVVRDVEFTRKTELTR